MGTSLARRLGMGKARLPVIFAAAMLAAPAWAQSILFLEPGTLKASEILGREVQSADGASLGVIRDFYIDRRTRMVRYLEIGNGAYPLELLRSDDDGGLLIESQDSAAGGASAPPGVVAATTLIGRPVADDAGNALGLVVDMEVSVLDGVLAYAVVRPERGGEPLRIPAADLVAR